MDSIATIRAFVTVATTGSFTEAARLLDLVPSVVTKRVMQLEHMLGVSLLHRTTRKVTLSAAGEHHLPRFKSALAAHDEAIAGARKGVELLSGPLVVKVPATLGHLRLNDVIYDFARAHPDVNIELLSIDGPMNPAAEGIDIAITAFPDSFGGVAEEFLWPIRRGLYASPQYLTGKPELRHPAQLADHQCLAYRPAGSTWTFRDKTGLISMDVKPRLCSNDMTLLLQAARNDMGIALLSDYVAASAAKHGEIVNVLGAFQIADLWIKALIPRDRLDRPRTAALLKHIKRNLQIKPQSDHIDG